ncbi:hypothetical protein PGH07_07770 [Sulfurovum sp. zt1-1]|uniref:Uncharacterized protein n=1 Tax=Sulfurovum zhangzhouensis TaxID=3019067 RepID=A0ABT7QZ11_9BACT|nr:hypothetical protein [Sulfurovum zhangzhouensis]MDM5272074.1 hypothetical protein [Sulfurovum zhangzhouensis]
MRKQITNTGYTQVNTNPLSYLIQNITTSKVLIVVLPIGVQGPAADADYDFILNPDDGISDSDVEGIIWAKSTITSPVDVSVVEG